MKSTFPYVRMKDVAEAAGCTAMTVSMALRNNHRISTATRRRIHLLAKKMGYRPDPFVSAFVIRRRKPRQTEPDVLAVLTKFDRAQGQQTPLHGFYAELWKGLEQRATELGFRLEEFPVTGPAASDGRVLTRILNSRGIRGILLFPGGNLERSYPALDWNRFAAVAAGFHDPALPLHRVASDYARAVEIALTEITRRGYQRPGLAMTSSLDPLIRYAISGRFLSWQATRPRLQQIPLIPGKGEHPGPASFLTWLRKHQPDVVFALEPGITWMRNLFLKQGPKTGFVHLAKKKNDSFAGVNLHTANVGRTAIDVLARELYLNRTGLPSFPEVVLTGGRWENGKSLAAKANFYC